jgi:hypothetical protein
MSTSSRGRARGSGEEGVMGETPFWLACLAAYGGGAICIHVILFVMWLCTPWQDGW